MAIKNKVVIIFTEEGIELRTPVLGENVIVPQYMQYAVALAALISGENQEFDEMINKKLKEFETMCKKSLH